MPSFSSVRLTTGGPRGGDAVVQKTEGNVLFDGRGEKLVVRILQNDADIAAQLVQTRSGNNRWDFPEPRAPPPVDAAFR